MRLNPKSEYRNSKQFSNTPNSNVRNFCFEYLKIRVSDLFRISCFVLQNLIVIWGLIIGICVNLYADELDLINRNFLQGEYELAISECQKIIRTNPRSSKMGELRYLMGLSYLKLNDPAQANSAFQEAVKLNLSPHLKEKVELGIGEVYFLNEEIEEARTQFKNILSNNRKTPFASTIYFHLGSCALKLGSWEEAKTYFNKISQEYPLSFEAPIAQEIIKNADFYFTLQIGSFASAENAQGLYQSLKDKGYDAYLSEFKQGDRAYHRVRVGKFNTRVAALAEEEKLKTDHFPTHLWP